MDIDATASSAFAFNGSKIIIKASEFTGNITTTGEVRLLNGASVNWSIFDSTADSEAIITLPSWWYNRFAITSSSDNADDVIDDSSLALFSWTDTENRIRYLSSSYSGQTMYITTWIDWQSDTELYRPQIVPVAPWSHSFTTLSFSESAQIAWIEAKLEEIKPILELTRDYARIAGTQRLSSNS